MLGKIIDKEIAMVRQANITSFIDENRPVSVVFSCSLSKSQKILLITKQCHSEHRHTKYDTETYNCSKFSCFERFDRFRGSSQYRI